MNVTFRHRIDDPARGTTRRFVLARDVPFPVVPQVGDVVMLPAGQDHRQHMGARHVAERIFTLDGGVILDFELDGLVNDVEAQVAEMLAAGYQEVGWE